MDEGSVALCALGSSFSPLRPPTARVVLSANMDACRPLNPPTGRPIGLRPKFDLHRQPQPSIYVLQPLDVIMLTPGLPIMEPHTRATSSVYSVAFDLDTLLEQITTAQVKEHQSNDASDEPPKSYGDSRTWGQRAAMETGTLSESREFNQTLEQQLIAQNDKLQERLDSARKHFARLYNAMNRAMEVSRELYDIHLHLTREGIAEQEKDRASGEYF